MENVDMDDVMDGGGEDANLKEPSQEENVEDEEYKFPSSIEEFKYAFNEKGELRHIESDERFVFAVSDKDGYNQKRYEAFGELITKHVFELLEKETELLKVYVPVETEEGEPRSFIYMSKDALTNPNKLLLLIHGSGVVRAGQWARRLIINDCLDSGSQLPFIKRAVNDGYGVIVFNTNLNEAEREDSHIMEPIRLNASPKEHSEYVWREFMGKAAAQHIAIIAHSYGGIVTTDLATQFESDFERRVFAIAFTDSVHSLQHQNCSESTMLMFEKIAQNWVTSEEPLDTPIPNFRKDCPMVSAGHLSHANTSWSSFKSIFTFLKERYEQMSETEGEKEVAKEAKEAKEVAPKDEKTEL